MTDETLFIMQQSRKKLQLYTQIINIALAIIQLNRSGGVIQRLRILKNTFVNHHQSHKGLYSNLRLQFFICVKQQRQ